MDEKFVLSIFCKEMQRCKDAKMYDVQKGVIYEEKKWG